MRRSLWLKQGLVGGGVWEQQELSLGRQKIETRLEKTTITEKWKEIIHNSTTQNELCLISVNVFPPSFITLRVVKANNLKYRKTKYLVVTVIHSLASEKSSYLSFLLIFGISRSS